MSHKLKGSRKITREQIVELVLLFVCPSIYLPIYFGNTILTGKSNSLSLHHYSIRQKFCFRVLQNTSVVSKHCGEL